MTTYFTSDLHLGHKKLHSTYNPRRAARWPDIDEMNEGILEEINSKVKESDTLYHLGDLSFMPTMKTVHWLSRIRCRTVNLIKGNHDSYDKLDYMVDSVNKIVGHEKMAVEDPQIELKIKGVLVVLNHFPLEVWENSHYGSYHLHGHCHGNLAPRGRRLDVGFDSTQVTGKDLQIFSFDEIHEKLKSIAPHGKN